VISDYFKLFQITLLPAWHPNHRQQSVKAPKLHFLNTGLACAVLGIRTPEQLASHPQRGAIFESWVVSEVMKARLHQGPPGGLFHFREARGPKVYIQQEKLNRRGGHGPPGSL